MNPLKNKKRIKMFVALGFALLATTTISPRLFIANSPEINTQFIAEIQQIPNQMVAFIRREPDQLQEAAFATLQRDRVGEIPEGLTFAPIATGVSAAENQTTGETLIQIEAGTKLKVSTIELDDGRVVTVYTPIK